MRRIKTESNGSGLRKGQLPEYSAIQADELFAMLYRRNWFQEEQIDSIATFNMCRDRHLILAGAVPVLWNLDKDFTDQITFYIYIPKRGIAWVFEQENNPFTDDAWNRNENKKLFRKHKTPYKLPNFLCEIHFDDWEPNEKEAYLKIRNEKRLTAISSNKSEKIERYGRIKAQRDKLVRLVFKLNPKLKNTELADMLDISDDTIRNIREGLTE